MRIIKTCSYFLLVFFLFVMEGSAFAYTFFVDVLASQKTAVSIWPYQQGPIHFWIDRDPFQLDGQDFASLMQRAAFYWTQAPETSLRIQLHDLPEDINAQNIAQQSRIDDQRPDIILEQDGKILEQLGLDAEYVLGLGVPIVEQNQQGSLTGPFGGKISDAFVLVNTGRIPSARRLHRLLTHELGHALGIGHTNVVHLVNAEKLPVMFFDTGLQQTSVVPHADDMAAISTLYPTETYERAYGAIEGEVLRADGTPVFGAVILADPVQGGDPVGTWSDPNGHFGLYGLPPGDYTLQVRALNGDSFFYSMDPALHVGGMYKKATREFCAESYDDLPFHQCRIPPNQSKILHVIAGQRWTGLSIREGKGGYSPQAMCLFGSAPQLPEHPALFASEVPNQGPRDATCPAVEPSPEPAISEPQAEPIRPDAAQPQDAGDSKEPQPAEAFVPNPGCNCQTPTDLFYSWFLLGLLGLFLLRRRSEKRTSPSSKSKRFVVLLCLLGWSWAAPPPNSLAISVQRPLFQTLALRATTIAKVRVVSQEAFASQPLPLQRTTFALISCLKSPCPPLIHLELPAQRYKRWYLKTSGIPRFSMGAEYILFLRPNHLKKPILVGLSYGVFDLQGEGASIVHSRGQFFGPLPIKAFRRLLTQALSPALAAPHKVKRALRAHSRASSRRSAAKPRKAARYQHRHGKIQQRPAKTVVRQGPSAKRSLLSPSPRSSR
ncbi:MAG: carboxypeptidase regulatory-like domain-containing protein [Myxococcales bacterium]|nr:carboxypeptidase regulatory-like domain-containing protein [Myxococcales bacterium]